MTKTRRRRVNMGQTASGGGAAVPPSKRSRTVAARAHGPYQSPSDPSRLRQVAEIAALPLIALVGVVAWWLLPFGDPDGGRSEGDRSIATLDAPDVHSLLIDPTAPDHVLFGSHAGVMESRDGGFTWESGGLRDADAMSMAASPNDPATLYVAGHDVFRVSRDGGKTWQPLQSDLPGADIHAFASDPAAARRLYAYVAGDRIYASNDGGTAWAALPAQPSGPPLALASNGAALYAATANGIEVSRDRGATWAPLPAQPAAGASSVAVTGSDPPVIYAGTPRGVAKSTDGGATWENRGSEGVPVAALAVAPSDPNRVLFVTPQGGVYRSDDSGKSWLAPD